MVLRQSILNQTDVSLSLSSHLISAKAKDANLIFSPLSIHVVLCLLAAGSAGPTRGQLLGYLKSKSTEELNTLSSQLVTLLLADDGGPLLAFANGVGVDQSLTLKPDFKAIVENDYKSASNHVDFQTKAVEVTQEVNAWVDKQTNGLIKDILPPGSVNSFTRLIFANAVYFKGTWKEKFASYLTRDHKFLLLNGTSVHVRFMSSKERQLIRSFDGIKVLTLLHKQGEDKRKFSMHIFLPDAKDGLPSLVENFGSEPEFIECHLPYKQVKVGDFLVPKFKFSFEFEASELLKGQGLVLPFSGSEGLTEMVSDSVVGQSLYVPSIFHKAFIEVNEEGTEAAAASVMMCGCSLNEVRKDTVDFVVDHPFLFVVREDVTTRVVIFVGQVVNPRAGYWPIFLGTRTNLCEFLAMKHEYSYFAFVSLELLCEPSYSLARLVNFVNESSSKKCWLI